MCSVHSMKIFKINAKETLTHPSFRTTSTHRIWHVYSIALTFSLQKRASTIFSIEKFHTQKSRRINLQTKCLWMWICAAYERIVCRTDVFKNKSECFRSIMFDELIEYILLRIYDVGWKSSTCLCHSEVIVVNSDVRAIGSFRTQISFGQFVISLD